MTQTSVRRPYTSAASPRRRGGALPAVLAVLLLLTAVLVVGDRLAAKMARDELRAQLVAQLADRDVSYSTLDVTIDGFPFLAQVAEGRYDRITIDMTDVGLNGQGAPPVSLPSLDVVASGVVADAGQLMRGEANPIADQVTGTAVVSYATLEGLADYSGLNLTDVRFSPVGSALRATGTAHVASLDIPIEAVAEISVVDGQFQVNLREASAVGVDIPAPVRRYLDSLARSSVLAQLPPLPFELTLEQVRVEPTGLAITATGHDVPLGVGAGA